MVQYKKDKEKENEEVLNDYKQLKEEKQAIEEKSNNTSRCYNNIKRYYKEGLKQQKI